MDAKKVSFGFSKVTKKPNILPSKTPKEECKIELIKCLEGKEIKLIAEKTEAAPLVIQMPANQKTSTALASLMKRRAVLLGEEEADSEECTAEPQSIADVTAEAESNSLEQRAARELLAAAQSNGNDMEGDKLVLPALTADELPLDGAKEATLDDYDSVPIEQFGLAMLRGMGWVDPPPKKKGAGPVDDAPFLRPKGMGLGADKALKPKALLVQPEKNEILEIKKQAYVRILGGKQKDQYGQIEGFDDHAGRVIVKMAIGGNKVAFNEFLCQPVSRNEYSQYAKCINTAKYEEFKKQENEHGQIIIKREKSEQRISVSNECESRGRERGDDSRHKTKDEECKSYKSEHHSKKPEERRTDSRDYTDGSSTSNKRQGRTPYKVEERGRDDSSHSSRYHELFQDSLRNSSSTSKPISRRREQSSSDEADDTGESTESDSDSAYERKHKKKSKSKSSNSKSKKKKSKKGRSKSYRRCRGSSTNTDSEDSSHRHEQRRHRSKHKKTKKSKHARSRTRSRSCNDRARRRFC